MARHAEALRALGAAAEVKSGAECLALEPALRHSNEPVLGGVYDPDDESGDAPLYAGACAHRRFPRRLIALWFRSRRDRGRG